MMKSYRSLFLLSLALCLNAMAVTRALAQGGANDFRWQGNVAAGRAVEIKGVNGDVRAELGSGNTVEVVAVKRAGNSDPESVSVKLIEHAGGITVCAVYPQRDGEPGRCEPGGRGGMNVYKNDVKVDFVVRVPEGVNFIGRTVNGEVRAQGLSANAEAYTVNGNVKVSAEGIVQARTVNGSINASCGRADWREALEFHTVNGSIELTLPASAQAEIQARTVNGGISTDLPLFVQGEFSKRRLNGVLGSAGNPGRQLKLETVNGSIHVAKLM
jgi:DUF4097 and DUF4098 domain-containing protein YvlB